MDYADLITYLNEDGDAGTDTQVAVDSWRTADPKHEQEFQQVKRVWQSSLQDVPHSDAMEVWQQLQHKIESTASESGQPSIPWIWRIAATAAILLVTFGVWRIMEHDKGDWIRVNNSLAEETLKHSMPDGTKIELSPNSSISYPAIFDEATREVEMKGQARFMVEHQVDQPFIVKTLEHTVKVLGTTFDLMAYPDSQRHWIQLHEGRVRFSSNQQIDNTVELTPGQSAIFDRNQNSLTQVDSIWLFYVSEIDGIYRIENCALKLVAEWIEDTFEVSIDLEPASLGERKFRAAIPKEMKAKEIIELISFTFSIQAKREGGHYTLQCHDCPD